MLSTIAFAVATVIFALDAYKRQSLVSTGLAFIGLGLTIGAL